MFARLLILLYAIVSYAVFFVSFLYALGFVGNYLVPKSIDRPTSWRRGELARGHRRQPAAAWHIRHPAQHYGAPGLQAMVGQNLSGGLPAQHLCAALQPDPAAAVLAVAADPEPIWQVDGIAAWLLIGVYWLGWLIVLASTFMIDHFDLSGLRQAFSALRGAEVPGQSFRTPLLYKIVRHPIMLGFLLAFWATPEMTAGHLLFAVMTTAYILVGVQFEERDLIAEFGATYQRYRQRVPMLLPRIFGRRRGSHDESGAVQRVHRPGGPARRRDR